MRKLLKPWVVAVALVTAGITQAFAGQPVIGDMTVTPDEGFPGDPFTISGSNCPPPLGAAVPFALGIATWSVELSMTGGPEAQTFDLGTATPDESGNWTHETSVPLDAAPSAAPGDYDITGACTGDFQVESTGLAPFAQEPPVFLYNPHPFTVLAEEEPPPDEPDGGAIAGEGVTAPEPVDVQPAFTG